MTTRRTAARLEALGCILSDGLTYPWFRVRELDSEACTAIVDVETDTDQWETKHVTADDVARGLRLYREYLEGKREGYPGEWSYRAKDAIRAGLISDASEFVPTIHARAQATAYAWQTVEFDRTNGERGDYDANTADSVMQFALIGHAIYG